MAFIPYVYLYGPYPLTAYPVPYSTSYPGVHPIGGFYGGYGGYHPIMPGIHGAHGAHGAHGVHRSG